MCDTLIFVLNRKKTIFIFLPFYGIYSTLPSTQTRAGRVPSGTIVLSRERTERSHHSEKKECLERVLKNIGTISKRTEQNGTGIV